MPFDQIGILLISIAVIAAVASGAWAGHFASALASAVVIWALLLVAWYLWGPPLPYYDLASNIAGSIGLGIALCFVAVLASRVRRLFRGGAASS
jgi:hypothetical protein